MQKPITFLAMEAGSAAWMAPLWSTITRPYKTFLSQVALAHVKQLNMAPENVSVLEDDALPQAWRDSSPSLAIVSATERMIEADAVAASHDSGARTMQVIDSWGPYRSRFVTNIWPDLIAVVDDAAKREAISDGLPAQTLLVMGQPAWERSKILPGGSRDIIAFIGQPIAAKFGDKLGFDEKSAWKALVSGSHDWNGARPNFIYLAHPEEQKLPHVGSAYVRRDSKALREAGYVVGMYSSLMINALLGGRPVISFQPNGKMPDPCPLSRHGRIPRVTEPALVADALTQVPSAVAALRRDLAGSRDRVEAMINEIAA